MKKVHISFLHNLDNNEFGVFYSSLLKLIKERKFVDPTLTELQSRLKTHRNDVLYLDRRVQKFNDTAKISELTRLRTDYLISFRLDIKAKMLTYDGEMRLAGARLYTWLKEYKKEPFIQSIHTQDVVVARMLKCINEDESLKADIALLSLDKLIDAIVETTKQINMYVNHRFKEKQSRNKNGGSIRNAAFEDIRKLVNYIASKLSLMDGNVEESEHYKLLLDIHWELKDIRKTFRIRTAKVKTKREKEALKQLKATKDAELKQQKAVKSAEEKQSDLKDLNPQAEPSLVALAETLGEPSASESLTQEPIEVLRIPNKIKEGHKAVEEEG